jgi:hypothetical protein
MFLGLPLELRQDVYHQGRDSPNTAMVPQRNSQVHVGMPTYLPGSNLLAMCKKIREEGRVFLFGKVHFTTQYSNDGFVALRHFNWHKTSMALVESLDLHTSTILDFGPASWASMLDTLVTEMPTLNYLRVSDAFRGDIIDDTLMRAHGERLLQYLPHFQAYLLRFGSFVTLRHPTLRILAWSKPIGDTDMIDKVEGVIHYAMRLVADCELLGPGDMILCSAAIRQKTLKKLALPHPEDFLSTLGSPGNPSSEESLELSNGTNQSGYAAPVAVTEIEHLVYITRAERRRLGFSRQLNLDVLIEQARTGLLASSYAPVYHAIQMVRASLPQKKDPEASSATGSPVHVLPKPANDVAGQMVAAASDAQPIGGGGARAKFKRGDFMEYMLDHTDYLNTIDEAFATKDLPQSLRSVNAKKRRARKSNKSDRFEDARSLELTSRWRGMKLSESCLRMLAEQWIHWRTGGRGDPD